MSKQSVNIGGDVQGDTNVAGGDQTVGKVKSSSPWYIEMIKSIIAWFLK